MIVESLLIGSVRPNPRNSRVHSDHQVRDIARSIERFGWTLPLLIDEDGMLLAGHGRLRAAQSLGYIDVPCIRKLGLTDEEKRAYAIADNKIAEGSEWDAQLLQLEIRDLMQAEFDVGVLGFTDAEMSQLLLAEPTSESEAAGSWTEDDVAPALPALPVTRLGDVWVMARHRLMCGDSTSAAQMRALTQGQQVRLWLTDPPYNVAYEGGTGEKLTIMNDSMTDAKFREFLRAAYAAADAVMEVGASFYVWHADSEGFNFRGAARDVGWPVRQCLVWKKNALVMGRQDYHWQHEPCLYGWKPGGAHRWFGGRKQTTIREIADGSPAFTKMEDGKWLIQLGKQAIVVSGDAQVDMPMSTVMLEAKPKRNEEHPTMKPVALFEHQMLNSSALGDAVADSFGGSGTTLIAAQKTGRLARLMELDPKYCDVIVKRWQEYAGREAVLEASGQTFDAVASERLAG